jgi:hypothetical protein
MGRTFRRPGKRAKAFGPHNFGTPLTRDQKAWVLHQARQYNARHKQPGQHIGPLTRTTLEVLRVLLFAFHNTTSGRCDPSYRAIARAAACCVDTVGEAIAALEAAGILRWVHGLVRRLVGGVRRVERTSNRYNFIRLSRKPENPARTASKSLTLTEGASDPALEDSIARLKLAMSAFGAGPAADVAPNGAGRGSSAPFGRELSRKGGAS